MKIHSSISYATLMMRYVLILFAAFLFALLSQPFAWELNCIMGVAVLLLIVSRRITSAISFDSTHMIITYFIFFTRRELKVESENMELKLSKESTFRSPKYFLLKIFSNGKQVYTIDSRDGFEEQEFVELSKFFIA